MSMYVYSYKGMSDHLSDEQYTINAFKRTKYTYNHTQANVQAHDNTCMRVAQRLWVSLLSIPTVHTVHVVCVLYCTYLNKEEEPSQLIG